MNKSVSAVILFIGVISLTTCSSPPTTVPDNTKAAARNTSASNSDSLITGKPELAELYTQAIAEYITAIHKKDRTRFDTLFLGKIFDFPDISLPTIISETEIRLLTQEEIDRKKPIYRSTAPYVNLIGFVEKNQAEFTFVTFYPEFKHQYDCYMNFKYNPEKKSFNLDRLRIEVLIRSKAGTADHFAIYEAGKYTGTKALKGNQE